MKKYLAILFLCASNSVFAAAPSVYLKGHTNGYLVGTTQEDGYSNETLVDGGSNNLSRGSYVMYDSEIIIQVQGRSDTGVVYGSEVALTIDSFKSSTNRNGLYAEKAYVYSAKKGTGKIEIGQNEGPSSKMKFDASTVAVATGGIAGQWFNFVNAPKFQVADPTQVGGKGEQGFIIRPDLPLSHGYSYDIDNDFGPSKIDDTKNINRVAFYTPRISGLQFGISFAPDSGDRGNPVYGDGISGEFEDDVDNIIDWGVSYTEQAGLLGIGLSITGETGGSERLSKDTVGFIPQDLEAIAFGGSITYGGFSMAASYGAWGESLMFVDSNVGSDDANFRDADAYYVTFGGSYEFGPFGASLTHMNSSYREQEFFITSAGLEYRAAPGLALYAEGNLYEFSVADGDVDADTIDNSGIVTILGINLKF